MTKIVENIAIEIKKEEGISLPLSVRIVIELLIIRL